MSLEAFLHQLHFDTDKARPLDFEVDWEDAPLPFKLYRGLPVIPLSAEIPLTLEGSARPAKADLRELGHFLWYAFGLTQFSQTAFDWDSGEEAIGTMQSYRRFVPSGGAMYPNELYVYLKVEEVPSGIYHYDVAHHRLVLLREGNFDSYLSRALGNRCDVSACFGAVFVATMFWKNFYKYYNFAYRLQGLDSGALIGQLLEVSKRFGYELGVYFQFLDRAVNHLLGVSEREESVYAVIPLSLESGITWFAKGNEGNRNVSAAELSQELPAVRHDHFVRSQKVLEYPMLIQINEASRLESLRSVRQIWGEEKAAYDLPALELPHAKRMTYDLAAACKKRYSPERDFVLGKVSREQLATLLHEVTAAFSYRNDLDEDCVNPESRVLLYGCFYNVEDIPDGAYQYDRAAHALRLIRPGDHRHWLQEGMNLDNVNLFQVPLCFHVAGERNHLLKKLGYRGYRIQQMEAGMLVQRLLLTASAIGMGGHPLLGYDVSTSDELYQMAQHGKTSLIQIPVGPCRPRPRLEGGLHG
ncbi:SagB family peptide dehydrogenase [Brevibacillus panacihumi]|uniref:SagB/ThcOx family dehydrogenase n=1 Tax=Brevibacillus panacihumi TaxID=497735 RepID=A0A3M8CP11_9BACL|nr:SagB family peptide dehydrogenase [Brevibacillus panacihumi]RNB77500.1 SagB/ThcOx family dehydrogenase [Brevibacillus panacihumi]